MASLNGATSPSFLLQQIAHAGIMERVKLVVASVDFVSQRGILILS
jgi:hypothetical protein